MSTDYFNTAMSHYAMMVKQIAELQDPSGHNTIDITLTGNLYGTEPALDKFFKDIALMNVIRVSHDPAIKDAFESLLTTMALVQGRDAQAVLDRGAKESKHE